MVDRYVKTDENKKIIYIDASNLYGWAMSQFLFDDEIDTDKIVKLEDILSIPNGSDFGFFC